MRSERRDPAGNKIAVRATGPADKPVHRTFPGPRDAGVTLRVAVERAAYADLIAHAKESLEAEVCGVLVGQICADDEGRFVHVEAIIRGAAATQAATHVTFTQATWDAIHETLEREHPKRRIVGWYHTHPGFGVEFSEMDLFIQRNFFAGAGQIALVTDPLSGAVAIVVNTASGIEYLSRFWVDAREQLAKVPPTTLAKASGNASMAGAAQPSAAGEPSLQALEARIAQLIQAQDDIRALFHRFLFTIGFVICFGVIATVSYVVYKQYTDRLEPPRLNNFVPVPVQIGDKRVLLGVGVVEWDVPPELNALLLEMKKQQAEQELELKRRDADNESKEPTRNADAPRPAPAAPVKSKSLP